MYKKHLQLYSLKDEVKGDFEKTLRKVKEIGYDGVEFFGGYYGNLSAADMKKLLGEIGLEPISSHVVTSSIAAQVEYAAELGIRYLIDPYADFKDYEAACDFSQKLNEAGKLCKQRGIVFGYHNHAHEFAPCKDGFLLETVIENTDPELVCFQLDVGWAEYAGVNATDFLGKYPDRFKSIHFKECGDVEAPEDWNVAAGKGKVDWESVFKASFAQGIDCFIVEREHDYAGDIYKCVKEDYDYISRLLE